MSGRVVSLVLESALPAWLKIYAAAFASFASDDGSKVFPTLKRIARMVGKSERQAQRATTELRRLAILEVLTPSGRATATRYHFHVERLPLPGAGESRPLFHGVAMFPQRKMAKAGLEKRFPQLQQQLTGHRCRIDPSSTLRTNTARALRARKTGTAGE